MKRPWIWIVGGTLVAVLALVGLYLSSQTGDPSGWPAQARAWNLKHAVPDGDNAFPIYGTLTGLPGASPSRWGSSRDWSLRDELLPSIEGQERSLGLLMEASRKPACFRPFDPHLPLDQQPTRSLHVVQQAANLLVLDARHKAAAGRSDEALDALMAAVRIGGQQRQALIDQLVGIAVRGVAWPRLERLAMDAPPPPEALEKAEEEIRALEARLPTAAETVETELVYALAGLEQTYNPKGFARMTESSELSGTLLWAREAFLHPLGRTRAELAEAYGLLSKGKLTRSEKDRLDGISRGSLLLQEAVPCFPKAEASRQRDLACSRGTRLLLSLRAHRIRHGSYPETVEALEDPYSGKPFVYKKLPGDAFLLYSVGPDGKDGGGSLDYRDGGQINGTDLKFGRPPTP